MDAASKLTSTVATIWQDSDLLVVSKPVGLLVDSGKRENDLISWAQSQGHQNAFAFHRLDRGTSGLVLMGKTRNLAREMTEMFEKKTIRKAYLAVVEGTWPSSLTKIDQPIEDKTSTTTFRKILSSDAATVIECLPKTGRTHQIRIHCANAGHPILGDTQYELKTQTQTQTETETDPTAPSRSHALHAYRLDFRHPRTGETVSLRSEPSEWLTTWLKSFEVTKAWSALFQNAETRKN